MNTKSAVHPFNFEIIIEPLNEFCISILDVTKSKADFDISIIDFFA